MDHHQHEHHHHQPAGHPAAHEMPHGDHSGHGGHHDHAGHAGRFRDLFWINLVLSIPVVLYSEMVQDWLRFSMPEFTGSDLIAPVLGSVIFFYGGSVFLTGGWSEIRQRQPGMMLLISLAIIVAYVASVATFIGWFDLDFWWELALLVTIMLLGHWQEMRAIGQAQGALSALADLIPDEAERVLAQGTETVPVSALAVDDLILVRPGGRVPVDGVIIDGDAELDESTITGESRPVAKGPGDTVTAGTVVSLSSIRVRVQAVGDDTSLAGIQRLVAEAQSSRSRAQALADRFAAALFYIAVVAGVVTFVVWSLIDSVGSAVSKTVTVLVISCPHALGLAIPLVISISTAVAAKHGILVKDRLAMERMRLIDTVLFDKTGTLTRGEHRVTELAAVPGEETAMLGLAAAAESDSEHPVARAIVQRAQDDGIGIPAASDFRAESGRGVRARVGHHDVRVGGPAMLRENGLTVPAELEGKAQDWAQRGASVLHVVRDARVIGVLALEDAVREESLEAVQSLQGEGVSVVMITGDAQNVAETVAGALGIDEVFAGVLPEDKQSKVVALQERRSQVAMVGDGVNDAPALAQADVGIAIGAGTDVAIESAGLILATSDPRAVVQVRRLSAATYRKMIENLGWAAGYNIVAIPLAAGVLAPVGFTMPPAVGALLMSISTIVVAFNAQLLRRVTLPGT